MIFAPIVQIANECHCFFCTRGKLSGHDTCTICKPIFEFANCTIYDCVIGRWGLTRFDYKCSHATIRCKCTKCLHSALLPHNYMSINILRSVDKDKNHLHACMHLSALTSEYGRSSACTKTVVPTAHYGIGRAFFLSEQPEARAPYAVMCSRHYPCTLVLMLISASHIDSADKCKQVQTVQTRV